MFAEKKEKQNAASKKDKDHQSCQSINTCFDKIMQKSLKQKLFAQTTKTDMMHDALTQQKESFKTILEGNRAWNISLTKMLKYLFLDLKNHHESRIFEMEKTVSLTQELVKKQSRQLQDQVEKLVLSENIIEQLIAENENMTFKISLRNPSE